MQLRKNEHSKNKAMTTQKNNETTEKSSEIKSKHLKTKKKKNR